MAHVAEVFHATVVLSLARGFRGMLHFPCRFLPPFSAGRSQRQ